MQKTQLSLKNQVFHSKKLSFDAQENNLSPKKIRIDAQQIRYKRKVPVNVKIPLKKIEAHTQNQPFSPLTPSKAKVYQH